MRIAFIVNQFPSLSETFILNQVTGFIDLGHDVEIFAHKKFRAKKVHSDVEKYNLMKKVSYFEMSGNRFLRVVIAIILLFTHFHQGPEKIIKSLNIFKYGKDAFSLKLFYSLIPMLNKDFDIIYCHFGPNGILGSQLKEIGVKGKFITTFHGYDLSSYIVRNGEGVYKNLFAKGDLFLPISCYWKNILIKAGCDDKKMRVHRMGINLERYKYSKKRIQSGETIKILTIGRLVEKKGHEFAIRAMKKVTEKYKKINYIVAGDGPLRNQLEYLVDRLGISEHVKFIGSVDQNEVFKLYQQSHIFCLSSVTSSQGDQEGIPVVLMEAQAAGLPIISTYHTGIPELVINGKSGFLVPERDIDALAERFIFLIEHPEIWEEMGRYGRRIVQKKYDIRILNKQLIDICIKLLNESTSRDGYLL